MDSEKRENIKWSLFLLGLVAAVFFSIILMCIGFYHVFFEEPQSLPYEVIVYDRSNKAIIDYGAVCEVKDGVLYLYDAKHRRTTMKSVLLGIMYERGATAIGEQFNKSAEWAQQLIDNFYKSFPKINQYRLKIENMAETYGYVTTITGRKRRLPDMQLEDKDDYRYQEAHRQSLNSVIQGSSADIMKLSMIAIYNDPRYKALDCHMIITVHDELIMEVPEDHIKEGAELLVGTMKRVGHSLIDLPMSVDAEVNDYWYGENLAEKYGV